MKKCKECASDFEGYGRLCVDCKKEIEEAKANLTKDQKQFVEDAEEQGFEVDYFYSGRGMCGKFCPAVHEGRDDPRFGTKTNVCEDSMGLGRVIYARY